MSQHPESVRVGYVLKRFPRLSETFILNELLTLQSQGADVDIYSLLKPAAGPRHALLDQLDFPVIGLAPYGKSTDILLADALDGNTQSLTSIMGNHVAPLFSGNNAREIAVLHMKAAVVALRARSRGITHLHAHFGSEATTVALLAAGMMQGSFSFTAHAKDIYHTYVDEVQDREMRRTKIREAAFVTTVSDYNVAYLRTLCPEAAHKIYRLYNGIDLRTFKPVVSGDQIAGRIIAVGRLVEKKGFRYLVEACGMLKERGIAFDCHLVGDGPLESELTNQIADLQLEGHVHLVGSLTQERLIERMNTATMAILPCVVADSGDRDGLPTVLLEAMAKALPVVTTTVTGGPEIVDDGITGLLSKPGDSASLAFAIQQLLEDPARAQSMGRRGRERARKLFDLETNVSVLGQYFTNQCDNRFKKELAV